jgi:hypothetical protein
MTVEELKAGAVYTEHVNKDPVAERFLPLAADEDGFFPRRVLEKSEELNLDLDAVKVSHGVSKAYDKMKLAEDAAFLYGWTTEQKQKKLEELKLEVMAANPSYLGVPASELVGQGLFVSGGTVTIAADQPAQGFTISSGFHHDGTVSMNSVTFASAPTVQPGNVTITGICP